MVYRFIKRLFDIVSSGLALLVLSPLFLISAVGIKLSSPGPVFYKTVRPGLDAVPFTMYKFRSMHEFHADPANPEKKTEGTFIANEDRIFPFGAILRKSKVDELPQLINVLRGQISVVGPRPVTLKGVDKYYIGRYECLRHIKPGLAGLDSVYDYAHGELFVKDNDVYRKTVQPMKLELAKLYGEKRSVGLDIRIIVRTVVLILQISLLKKTEFPYTKYEKEAEARLRQL